MPRLSIPLVQYNTYACKADCETPGFGEFLAIPGRTVSSGTLLPGSPKMSGQQQIIIDPSSAEKKKKHPNLETASAWGIEFRGKSKFQIIC